MKNIENDLCLIAVKVVDGIFLCGYTQELKSVIKKIRSEYTVGTVVYARGNFGMNNSRRGFQN